MKNNFLNFFRNTITINVKGKNIERFLKRLVREKIELYKIDVIHYNEINIKISYKDLERVLEIKTIYDVEIVNYYGLLKFKRFCVFVVIFFNTNRYLKGSRNDKTYKIRQIWKIQIKKHFKF